MIINKRRDCQTCGIRNVTILNNASSVLLEIINSKKYCLKYLRGEEIVKEGTPIEGVYIVSSGIVKIHKQGRHGRQFILRLATTGSIIGLPMEENQKHDFTVTAVEDSNVCFVEHSDFREALRNFPELKDKLLEEFSRELKETELRAISLAQLSVREKVAESIHYLAKTYKINNRSGFYRVNVGRQDIAEFTGTTKEQVSKYYGEFESLDIIAAKGRLLHVKNMERLEEIFH